MTVVHGNPAYDAVATSARTPSESGASLSGTSAEGSVWSDMVATLRERLGLDGALDDSAIAHSIEEINRFIDPNARWQAAFDSTLGHWLALSGRDLHLALAPIVVRT